MLKKFLEQEKNHIVKGWFDRILETYPADSHKFLNRVKEKFTNPVGHTLNESIQDLYEELLRGFSHDRLSEILEKIVKIRAVQDFPPSSAVGLFFLLKNVIRDALGERIYQKEVLDELLKFESRLDTVLLIAFDIYSSCREKISEIRIEEVKNRVSGLLKRANLIGEISDEPDFNDTV